LVLELSHWALPERFLFHHYPALTHLSVTTYLPLEDLLTRYDLHRLSSLCVLKINYYYGHLISNGGKRISPERITPPASGSTVQFRALKRLALLTIPHESLSQLERLFPALCQIRLYNLPGYCPKAS